MSGTGARCPVGGERVDESAAQVNATIVVVVLVASVVMQAPWLIGYLVVDYLIKLVFGFAYSPNCLIAKAVADALDLECRPVNSAPKRFAAVLALSMGLLSVAMAYTLESMIWFNVVAVLFIGVASLDAFADFCLGCFLFGLLPERVSTVLVRR